MSMTLTGELNLQDITEAQTGEWFTPDKILDPVREYFDGAIPLDPCTTPNNPTKARRFWTPKEDGLTKPFSKKGTFINAPYGKKHGMHAWLTKIHNEAAKGRTIIALLPMGSRFSTAYWQEDVLNEFVTAVCWVNHRITFLDENGELRWKIDKETGEFELNDKGQKIKAGNPYDSAVWLFNGSPYRFAVRFGHLGKVYKLEALA